MTHYIAHRINTVEQLKSLPTEFGVELDLRDFGNELVLEHDPFTGGEKFSEYLRHYQHGTMILNVKSERIEHRVLELLVENKITDYFFLDSSIPMIYLLSKSGEKRSAVRFSEIESIETVLLMADKVDWVWVDCFSKLPIDRYSYKRLKEAGLKLCLVSPELQGRPEDIANYKDYLANEGIVFDAICTKFHNIELWK
jgi:hypothetical protein